MCVEKFQQFVQVLKYKYSFIWKVMREILNYLRKYERRNKRFEKKKWKLDSETPTSETRELVHKKNDKNSNPSAASIS